MGSLWIESEGVCGELVLQVLKSDASRLNWTQVAKETLTKENSYLT